MAWGLLTRNPSAKEEGLVGLPSRGFNDERSASRHGSWWMINLSTMGEVDSPLDDVESIRHRGLSTRDSDGLRMDMNVETDQMHSDSNSMTRVARPLDDDSMARRYEQRFSQRLEALMTQWLRMIRWRDDTSRGSRSDSMTQWLEDDQLDALRPEVSASARGPDDAMVGCYNDEMEKKATMQIGR